MKQPYSHDQFNDESGNPAGGVAAGVGVSVTWQNGPLGRGADRIEPNGAFVETVIAIAVDRLRFYQESRFACIENAVALGNLEAALRALENRTLRREALGVEGTHSGH